MYNSCVARVIPIVSRKRPRSNSMYLGERQIKFQLLNLEISSVNTLHMCHYTAVTGLFVFQAGKLSLGKINELGQFVSEVEPEPDVEKKKKETFITKKKKEKEKVLYLSNRSLLLSRYNAEILPGRNNCKYIDVRVRGSLLGRDFSLHWLKGSTAELCSNTSVRFSVLPVRFLQFSD